MDNLREVAEILGANGQAQTRLIVVGGSCGFANADDVVNRFYAAYPNEELDPFVSEHVQRIISAADTR